MEEFANLVQANPQLETSTISDTMKNNDDFSA